MAANAEQITQLAQSGWKGFTRFLFLSTAAVVLILGALGIFLL